MHSTECHSSCDCIAGLVNDIHSDSPSGSRSLICCRLVLLLTARLLTPPMYALCETGPWLTNGAKSDLLYDELGLYASEMSFLEPPRRGTR